MEQGNEKKALPKTGKRSFFGEIIESVAIAVILAVVIRLFILEPFYIPSGSMEPNLKENDRIIVSKLNYHFQEPFPETLLSRMTASAPRVISMPAASASSSEVVMVTRLPPISAVALEPLIRIPAEPLSEL
jgi:hypothetical protein